MFRFMDLSNYLLLLVGILVFIGIYIFKFKSSKVRVKRFYSERLIRFYFDKLDIKSYGFYHYCLVFSGLVLVVISLFRPQYGSQKLQMNAEGVELVFVVDVSQSMAAEDVKPQRLKLAQIQLKNLTKILDGNRMGIVAFAGQVGVISPLTQDIGAINLFIDSLDFEIFSEQGTNISFALAEAKDLLERSQSGSQNSRTKVVVLVSDGEDHSGEALASVNDLRKNGIRTFVIGVGTLAGGKIPVKDNFGQTVRYLKGTSNNDVISKPNFKFLKELSKSGDGGFYKLDFGSVANNAIVKDFEGLQKSKFESESFEVKGEYFQYALLPGIFLLIFSLWFKENSLSQKVRPLVDLGDD